MARTALPPDLAAAVARGGEAGRTFAEFDWDQHRLGPVATWPTAYRSVVAVALASRFPVVLWLGEDLTMVYNDGYIPALADKHPHAMGTPGLEVWWEIRDIIEPMLRGVVDAGEATWSDDLLLMLVDRGRPWERYFTFTYSPIFLDDGEVGGVFCAVAETTERVLGERRLRVLNALGAAFVDAKSVDETVDATISVCSEHPADLPFLALYLEEGTRQSLRAASPNVAALLGASAPAADFWQRGGADDPMWLVEDLDTRLSGLRTVWSEGCPTQALVIALDDPGSAGSVGTVVIGLTPYRPLDEQYRGFCRLLADQIASGITSAGAYEAERSRAESLAELDRAKTLFLTNVSHELRTPLTLMLGPAQDALALVGDDPELRSQLEVVERNGRRLLRLVNSLLDFARIEAGRATAQLVETDVGALTADIASAFGDICRRAGLDLVLDCPRVVGHVDPDMWETIVFNVLSNAFKFTFHGAISVRVAPGPDDTVRMSVQDTGVGIPEDELPRVFERFYRPPTVEGRSVEGSGIGLALVRNLVELHGGSISVTSTQGEGTTFTVTLPASASPPAPLGGAVARVRRDSIYVAEAAQWLDAVADDLADHSPRTHPAARLPERPIVLVADDNADLRSHLERVIGSRWSTVSAPDGARALDLVRRLEPDLVIADVMMPKLDGFGLIAQMRADPRLESIPVMILSARAGLEATGEGYEAGADDYLVKPFRSTELLNRVAARLKVATREHERRDREQLEVARAAILVELGSVLSAATDVGEILDGLLGPPLAPLAVDAVAVGTLEDGGELLRVSYRGALEPEISDRYHVLSVGSPVPIAQVAKTGRTMVLPDTRALDRTFDVAVADMETSVRAAILEPLRASDGGVVGALGLMWAAPRPFSDAEADLAHEVATMTARALDRVRRAERERQVAVALQDRLLDWGAHSAAAAISTMYRPASDAMRVGGDWYTVTVLGDTGRIGLSVGDVVGHGLPAATVMSELRSALAVAAVAAEQPGEVLDLLEGYARQVPGAACTTAAYVMADPAEGSLHYACAGHPYPLLVTADGEVRFLEDGRRPALAVASTPSAMSQGVAPLEPGSMLVLYSDGLVERRAEPMDAGLERLREAARGLTAKPVSDVCADLLAKMAGPGGYEDDVVLVALRPCGSTPTSFVDAIPAQVHEIPALRQRLRLWLEERRIDGDTAYAVLVCAGEAVANAVEHGNQFDAGKTVTLEVFLCDGEITVTVTDAGRWDADSAGTRRMSSRGRGLTLIHGMSDDVTMERARMGTRITMRHRIAAREGGAA